MSKAQAWVPGGAEAICNGMYCGEYDADEEILYGRDDDVDG